MAGINKLIERVQGWFHNVTRAWKTTSTVTLFGRVFPKRNVVAAGLGILCAVAVAGGAIFAYATTNQSQVDSPLVSIVAGGAVTTDKADTSSEEVSSATGVSNAGENAATDPGSVAGTAAAGDSAGSNDGNSADSSSSSSSTNAGNGSSASQGTASPSVAKTTVIHHPAEYTTVHRDAEYKTVHRPAVTEVHQIFYYDGTDITALGWGQDEVDAYGEQLALAGHNDSYGTAQVEVSPAYDEQVLVRDAYDEQVLVRDAWDETVTN